MTGEREENEFGETVGPRSVAVCVTSLPPSHEHGVVVGCQVRPHWGPE